LYGQSHEQGERQEDEQTANEDWAHSEDSFCFVDLAGGAE
jgi:hypothetical protein